MPYDAPFDPCRQWLGIDAVDLGDARRVLGVTPDERDPLVVLRAAEARLTLLRRISPGPFERARAGLLTRVEEAREKVLADIAAASPRVAAPVAERFVMPPPPSTLGPAVAPPARAHGGGGYQAPPPPAGPGFGPPRGASGMPVPPVPAVPPVPVAPPVPIAPAGSEQIRIRTAVYRKETPVAGIIAAMLMLAAVAGGLAYFFVEKGKKQKADGRREVATAESDRRPDAPDQPRPPEKPAVKPRPPRDPVSNMERMDSRRTRPRGRDDDEDRPFATLPPRPEPPTMMSRGKGDPRRGNRDDSVPADGMAGESMESGGMADRDPPPRPPATPKPPPSEMPAADTAALKKLDGPLREALAAMRDKDPAKAGEILEAAAAGAGDGPASDRVARWQQLAGYYKGFLGFREQALAAVRSGNEYDVNNQKVAVVEADDTKFVYRSAGGNKTVTRDKIPAGIVLAIVTDWFDDKPANHLYLGAYHLAKPESDPPRARKEFEAAAAGGADAAELMSLLDDPLFTEGSR